MGRRQSPDELRAKAKANGYKAGEHQERDSKSGLKYFSKGVKKKNALILYRFAVWYHGLMVEQYESRDAKPPDFDIVEAALLRENAPAPGLKEAKDFFRWLHKASEGRIVKKDATTGEPVQTQHMSMESLKSRAEDFYRAFTERTGTETDPTQRSEIFHWITHVLPTEGVVEVICKQKFNFGPVELNRNFEALWSDFEVSHERSRVQIHLMFLWEITSGGRIGAYFVSGVRYRDIHIVQERRADGKGYGYFYKWDSRYVKNNRNPDNWWLGTPGRDHPILAYDTTTFLLILALADNALFGYNTLDDLWDQDISDGETEIILKWNEDVLDLPICRAIGKDGKVSKNPLTQKTLTRSFDQLLTHANYVGVPSSFHQIRRYLGGEINRRYTEVERSQHLGQGDPRIFSKYVANCTSVDGRSMFLGEEPDHGPNRFFQSLQAFHEPGVPSKLPHALEREVEEDVQMQELKRQASAGDEKAEKSLPALRQRLRAQKLKWYQSKWLEERRDQKILTRGKLSPIESKSSLELTNPLPERQQIATQIRLRSPLEVPEKRKAMQLLYTLCTKDFTVYYYPGEEPVGGNCRFCGLTMSEFKHPSSHAHSCHRKAVANWLRVSPRQLEFCYLCAAYFSQGDQWDTHCLSHLANPPRHCGASIINRTVVRPSYCPFHLVSESLPPGERMRSWKRDKEAINHIKNEELRNKYPAVCCEVVLANETDLDCHLADVHGLHVRLNAKSSPKPKDETDDEKKGDGFTEDLPFRTEVAVKKESPALPSSTIPFEVIPHFSPANLPSLGSASSQSSISDRSQSWLEPASQTSSLELESGAEPPDFMWQYISLPLSPSLSPLREQPSGIPSGDNSLNSDESPQSWVAPCSLQPALSSGDTTPEPTMLDKDFTRDPLRLINTASEFNLTGDCSGRPSPLLPSACSPDTGTFDLGLFGGGTPNSPINLTVSPKEAFPNREPRLEEQCTPPRRIVLKTTASNSTGSREQSKKRRATTSSRMDDQANPPKRRIVIAKKPEKETTLPNKRIVIKARG